MTYSYKKAFVIFFLQSADCEAVDGVEGFASHNFDAQILHETNFVSHNIVGQTKLRNLSGTKKINKYF